MKKCMICGLQLAGSETSYKAHLNRFHGGITHKAGVPALEWKASPIHVQSIHPTRTTSRTTLQIVVDMEKTLGSAVIPAMSPWHGIADRAGWR